MSDYETMVEDAKRDKWAERNLRTCPVCGGDLICTQRFAESRVEPGCELWECGCGHEEEE